MKLEFESKSCAADLRSCMHELPAQLLLLSALKSGSASAPIFTVLSLKTRLVWLWWQQSNCYHQQELHWVGSHCQSCCQNPCCPCPWLSGQSHLRQAKTHTPAPCTACYVCSLPVLFADLQIARRHRSLFSQEHLYWQILVQRTIEIIEIKSLASAEPHCAST